MKLTERQETLALFIAGHDAATYLNLNQPQLCRLAGVGVGVLQKLMHKCDYRQYQPFLKWCAAGNMRHWLDGATPEELDDHLLDAALRDHARHPDRAYRTHRDLRGSCCSKCGRADLPKLARAGVILCIDCDGVRELARMSWTRRTGTAVDDTPVTLERLDGHRRLKGEK